MMKCLKRITTFSSASVVRHNKNDVMANADVKDSRDCSGKLNRGQPDNRSSFPVTVGANAKRACRLAHVATSLSLNHSLTLTCIYIHSSSGHRLDTPFT